MSAAVGVLIATTVLRRDAARRTRRRSWRQSSVRPEAGRPVCARACYRLSQEGRHRWGASAFGTRHGSGFRRPDLFPRRVRCQRLHVRTVTGGGVFEKPIIRWVNAQLRNVKNALQHISNGGAVGSGPNHGRWLGPRFNVVLRNERTLR